MKVEISPETALWRGQLLDCTGSAYITRSVYKRYPGVPRFGIVVRIRTIGDPESLRSILADYGGRLIDRKRGFCLEWRGYGQSAYAFLRDSLDGVVQKRRRVLGCLILQVMQGSAYMQAGKERVLSLRERLTDVTMAPGYLDPGNLFDDIRHAEREWFVSCPELEHWVDEMEGILSSKSTT